MSPDEIAATYEVLAPMSTDYANANLERAGQAQASYGPLAEAAMGGSRTAGIGNYTYNRLVRPAVDTMRDQLIVEGYSAALNKQLSDTLRQAQQNYSRAARNYASSAQKTAEQEGITIDDELLDEETNGSGSTVGSKEFAGSPIAPTEPGDLGTVWNLTEEQLEKIKEWARLYPSINYPGMYGGY